MSGEKPALLAIVFIIISMGQSGCLAPQSNSEAETPASEIITQPDPEFINAPDWVTSLAENDTYHVSCFYTAGAYTSKYQYTMARANGCDYLAARLHTQLRSWLDQTTQATGVNPQDIQSEKSELFREITAACILQATKEAEWKSPKNTIYIKLSLDQNLVRSKAVESYIKLIKSRPNLHLSTKKLDSDEDFYKIVRSITDQSL